MLARLELVLLLKLTRNNVTRVFWRQILLGISIRDHHGARDHRRAENCCRLAEWFFAMASETTRSSIHNFQANLKTKRILVFP